MHLILNIDPEFLVALKYSSPIIIVMLMRWI